MQHLLDGQIVRVQMQLAMPPGIAKLLCLRVKSFLTPRYFAPTSGGGQCAAERHQVIDMQPSPEARRNAVLLRNVHGSQAQLA